MKRRQGSRQRRSKDESRRKSVASKRKNARKKKKSNGEKTRKRFELSSFIVSRCGVDHCARLNASWRRKRAGY